jgi:hypothetical protein
MPRQRANRRFAERVDAIISSIWTTDYDAIVAALDRLQQEELENDPPSEATSAGRRALADVRVLAAHKKRRPVDECEALFLGRAALGFSTVADEVIAVAAHARYCRDAEHPELAARHATAAVRKIDLTRTTARPAVPMELESILRDLAGGQ